MGQPHLLDVVWFKFPRIQTVQKDRVSKPSHGVKEYPFTIPLILSVEVGTLICVWLYSEEPNRHSPCGSN